MTGPEIVEQVARVYYDATGDGTVFEETWDDLGESARAPYRHYVTTITTALLDAIVDPSEAWSDDLIHGPILCAQIWRAMIDALRKEIGG